jgi:TPR repeat protein
LNNTAAKITADRLPRNTFPESMEQALRDELYPAQFVAAATMLEDNASLAVKDLEVLAKRGSLLSMALLGDAYVTGNGVGRDVECGLKWLQRAADGGSIEGRFRLAKYYAGLEEYDKAIAERRALCALGYAPAMYLLGWMYHEGRGVDLDVEKAIRLWEMADKAGHLNAKRQLAYLYRTGRFGIAKRFVGHLKLASLIPVFVRYMMRYPNSDRLRTS